MTKLKTKMCAMLTTAIMLANVQSAFACTAVYVGKDVSTAGITMGGSEQVYRSSNEDLKESSVATTTASATYKEEVETVENTSQSQLAPQQKLAEHNTTLWSTVMFISVAILSIGYFRMDRNSSIQNNKPQN